MSRAPQAAAHFNRPADVAASLAGHAAVVVTGPDAGHSAMLAVAVARAVAVGRNVVIGDLTGDAPPIYALAGGDDAVGLADCFRDGLPLDDIARPVPGTKSLFVLPAGANVAHEPTLRARDRWLRLVAGFAEAGGLLLLVCREDSPLLTVLHEAGAGVLYDGRDADAPRDLPLLGTIGALPPAGRPPRAGGIRAWHIGAAGVGAALVAGWSAMGWIGASHAADGMVVIRPARTVAATPAGPGSTAPRPDTVAIIERTPADDEPRVAPFVVAVVAASTAAGANSVARSDLLAAHLPAVTISVVTLRESPQRAVEWHKAMFGAWRDARDAQAALDEARRRGVVARDAGRVERAPYAVLLADSLSRERAAAVLDVWRAKGVTPYALTQDDGRLRAYAGAFETVAQAAAMAAMVQRAGGRPIVAYRTGRPD